MCVFSCMYVSMLVTQCYSFVIYYISVACTLILGVHVYSRISCWSIALQGNVTSQKKHVHAHTHTYTYIHIHTHTHTHMHNIHMYMHTHVHVRAHTHTFTCTCRHVHMYMDTCTCTCTDIHMNIPFCIHTYSSDLASSTRGGNPRDLFSQCRRRRCPHNPPGV